MNIDALCQPEGWHPAAKIFPLMSDDELRELARDIGEKGLLQPIMLFEGKVLDGRNRLLACRAAGVTPRFEEWTPRDGLTPTAWVVSLNLERRHLTSDQRACCAVEVLPLLEAEAKERQEAQGERGVEGGRGKLKTLEEKIPQGFTREPQSRDVVAKLFNTNEHYVAEAKRLKAESPDTFEAVKAGKIRLSRILQEKKRESLIQAIETTSRIDGLYNVIAIDPPWQYANRADDVTHRARNPYPSMTIEDIKALEIPAAEDCVLWLWTTNAFMHEAYHVLEAWGFTPKTVLTWVKDRMGTGDWLRGQTEHCLMAVKGRPPVRLTNQTTVIYGPLREHSRKPDEFYALVESLCPGSKLEMFARTERKGWESHGCETNRFPNVA